VHLSSDHHPTEQIVSPVHDRMPVILPRALEDAWLDPELPRDYALELLQPYDDAAMTSRLASRLVNSVKNDGVELLTPAGSGARPDRQQRSSAERLKVLCRLLVEP
jgi:SOS response associated peptidase (SRAP)